MSDFHSTDRIKCVDYIKRHKKSVYKSKCVRMCKVNDLADDIQKFVGVSVSVNKNDILCSNCVTFYKKKFLELAEDAEETSTSENFIPEDELVSVLNSSLIKTLNVEVSPLKSPSEVRLDRREGYARKKKIKLVDELKTSAVNKLQDIYHVHLSSESDDEMPVCVNCSLWFSNIDSALHTCNYNGKVQLLTLVPQTFSKTVLKEKLPSVSKYLIDKCRTVIKNKGIYAQPDPYSGHPLPTQVQDLALSYYLEDSKDCSRESPNKKDVICIKDGNGEKVKKVKRFMTRSIKEAYKAFKKDNPLIEISLSKFYALRPRWVKIQPEQTVCSCIYCSNMQLICVALRNVTNNQIDEDYLLLKCLCDETRNEDCWLEECGDCPGTETLTVENFGLDEGEEVTFAIREHGDLIKKTVSVNNFLEHVRHWVKKAIPHSYIRKIQREGIAEARSSVQQNNALVLHFDFAENWSVVLPDEIQTYHWQTDQLSLFTCVAYFGAEIRSFVIVSDDIAHDSAHVLCALEVIKLEISKFCQLELLSSIVYITDGAAGHFKNRFQLYELCKNTQTVEKKWIFSATGHGKSACDAIGGLCKHFATKFNLRAECVNAIRDSASFVAEVGNLVPKITLLALESKTIQTYRSSKEKEWATVKPVVGIQSKHYWLIKNETYMGRTIKDKIEIVVQSNQIKTHYSINDFQVGQFVACVYDQNWWMGQITGISKELNDMTVSFMHPHGPAKGFQWPQESGKKKDECPVPLQNVLLAVSNPTPLGQSARLHTFDKAELMKIQQIYCL
ncbi:uncharacterized protein LOC134542780 [Bacillus rossius redtenbacheri]|uniref:uncharacterized protein LOC134542780 n=1 Tax=Bacillus rossius redtenbacheri TaxID=93214 RepID=UPI002FDCA839